MAMKKQIRLEKIDDAMEFVNLASKVKGDVWLSNESGSRASGKSILGVFDVAVNSPMDVEYPDDANEEFDDFCADWNLPQEAICQTIKRQSAVFEQIMWGGDTMKGILKKKSVWVSCLSAICVLMGATVAILVSRSLKGASKTHQGELDISGEDSTIYEGADF